MVISNLSLPTSNSVLLRALVDRDYEVAADRLSRLPNGFRLRDYYHLYALSMAGRIEEARAEASALSDRGARTYWSFMKAK